MECGDGWLSTGACDLEERSVLDFSVLESRLLTFSVMGSGFY